MCSVLGWVFSEFNHEIRVWVQVINLGSILGGTSGSWRNCGPCCCTTPVRWARSSAMIGPQSPKPTSRVSQLWLHFCSQISRDFSLVAKPNAYHTREGILENRAPAELCWHGAKPSTILPVNVHKIRFSVHKVQLTEQHFLCFLYQLSFWVWAPFWQIGKIFTPVIPGVSHSRTC